MTFLAAYFLYASLKFYRGRNKIHEPQNKSNMKNTTALLLIKSV